MPAVSIVILLAQAAFAAALAYVFTGFSGIIVAVAAGAVYLASLFYAVKDLGGISGDLSGYALTLGELGALIVCAIL